MALITITQSPEQVRAGSKPPEEVARQYCAQLEAGNILYIPGMPFEIPPADLDFLLGRRQSGGRLHKNIAYRANEDRITGFAEETPGDAARLLQIMRDYSRNATKTLSELLLPYQQRWKLDYASYRPLEEENRDLSLHKRNDLLHTDAFPSRPTNGDRILRFFTNINPAEPRKWMTTTPFDTLAEQFAGKSGGCPLPKPLSKSAFAAGILGAKKVLAAAGIPVTPRSPYDRFMLRFHNFLKENTAFQKDCVKEYADFPPNTCWMVYTDSVGHAVLSGRYALEQTYIVSKDAMVTPEKAPIRVLEKMVGARLTA